MIGASYLWAGPLVEQRAPLGEPLEAGKDGTQSQAYPQPEAGGADPGRAAVPSPRPIPLRPPGVLVEGC